MPGDVMEPQPKVFGVEKAMDREQIIKRLDQAVEASLIGLLIVLPIAHVTAIRSFLIVSTGVLWISRMAVSGDWKIRTPLDLPVLLYSAAVVISVFFAINPFVALKEVQGELLQYLVVFYAAAYAFRNEKQVVRLAGVLCGWVIILGLVGVAEFIYEGGSIYSLDVRFTSLARGCTNYSDYVALTMPLLAWTAVRLEGPRTWAGKLAVVVALATLILTHSRAGWIAVSVELLLFVYLVLRKRLAVGIIMVSMAVIAFSLPSGILTHGLKDGLKYATPEEALLNGTESVRMYQWTNGVKEMLKHPFEGFGYGRKNYVAGMQAAGPGTLDVSSCNAFLDAWLQLGIQGMIALVFIFFVLARTFLRSARSSTADEQGRSLLLCGFIAVAGFFVINQVEGSYVDEMAMTFWLLMGVFMGSVKAKAQQELPC